MAEKFAQNKDRGGSSNRMEKTVTVEIEGK